jgi:hypothetical protein
VTTVMTRLAACSAAACDGASSLAGATAGHKLSWSDQRGRGRMARVYSCLRPLPFASAFRSYDQNNICSSAYALLRLVVTAPFPAGQGGYPRDCLGIGRKGSN